MKRREKRPADEGETRSYTDGWFRRLSRSCKPLRNESELICGDRQGGEERVAVQHAVDAVTRAR